MKMLLLKNEQRQQQIAIHFFLFVVDANARMNLLKIDCDSLDK